MAESGLPPLNWLRAFEAAARHLSFTAAAQELHLTQSAVSQHIRSLEHFLGAALFVRRTRRLQLTEAGAAYLPTVREAFEVLAAGTRRLTGGDRGRRLTLQSNLAFTTFWLVPRLSRLLEAVPWLTLNLVTPIWDPGRTAAEAELEVRFGLESEQSDGAIRLARDRCYPVCSPAWDAAAADWRHATLFDCAGVRGNWEAWLAGRRQELPPGKLVNLASTFVISLSAAQRGVGLAMGHDTLVGVQLAEGSLARPYAQEIALPEAYYLTLPPKHGETPATRAFAAWIQAEFEASGRPLS